MTRTQALRDTGMDWREIAEFFNVDTRLARRFISGSAVLNDDQYGDVVQFLEHKELLEKFLTANQIEPMVVRVWLRGEE